MAAMSGRFVRHHNGGFAAIDLLACVAICAILFVCLAAGGLQSRATAERAECSANLKLIGTGMRVYATMNNGRYPRTRYDRGTAEAPPKPVWGTPYEGREQPKSNKNADPFGDESTDAPEPNDVTGWAYLFVYVADMPLEVFVCPSSGQTQLKLEGRTWDQWTNWPGKAGIAKHLSYSFQNCYASGDAVAKGFVWNSAGMTSEHAIAADLSPGDAVLDVNLNSNADESRKGNSLNHRGDGQNVLFGDGHIEWASTPFVGAKKDNIYTANGPEIAERRNAKTAIVASPADADDSILLPTAQLVGYERPTDDAPATQPK